MQVNCNTGIIKTNRKGKYGRADVWYMPKGIANIFYMNEIEKLHHITYNSIDGYYMIHTYKGPVCFHKDKQGLPYIDLDASVYDAATILVQMVHSNDEGFTKKDIKAAKAARKLQGIICSQSEKDYGGMVSSNMIKTARLIQPMYLMLAQYLDQTFLVSGGKQFKGNLNRFWNNTSRSQKNWFHGINLSPWRLMFSSSMT